jgi:hypothetical protein
VSIIEKKMTKLVLFKLKRGKTTYYVIYIYIYIYEVDDSQKGSFLLITSNIYLNGIKVNRKEINPSTNITPSFNC